MSSSTVRRASLETLGLHVSNLQMLPGPWEGDTANRLWTTARSRFACRVDGVRVQSDPELLLHLFIVCFPPKNMLKNKKKGSVQDHFGPKCIAAQPAWYLKKHHWFMASQAFGGAAVTQQQNLRMNHRIGSMGELQLRKHRPLFVELWWTWIITTVEYWKASSLLHRDICTGRYPHHYTGTPPNTHTPAPWDPSGRGTLYTKS